MRERTKKVVAVAEKPAGQAEGTAHRARPRSAKRQKLVDDHIELINTVYADADPRMRNLLLDQTVMWTEDVLRLFGHGHVWTYLSYAAGRDLAEAGELIHPGGIPIADTSGGFRGTKEVRGIIKGRLLYWGMTAAGRLSWNPATGDFDVVAATDPDNQIERARAALANPRLPEHHRRVLAARVEHAGLPTRAVGALIGMTKAAYTSKLRRSLDAAERL